MSCGGPATLLYHFSQVVSCDAESTEIEVGASEVSFGMEKICDS